MRDNAARHQANALEVLQGAFAIIKGIQGAQEDHYPKNLVEWPGGICFYSLSGQEAFVPQELLHTSPQLPGDCPCLRFDYPSTTVHVTNSSVD